MSEISKLNLGVEAVLSSLLDDESMKWITESALTERAFLIGARRFAEAIFPDQEIKKLEFAIMGTLWAREKDDSFASSEAGKLYSELCHGVSSLRSAISGGVDFDFPEETLTRLSILVERLSDQNRFAQDACQRSISQIRQGLAEIQRSAATALKAIDQIYGSSISLEKPLRYLNGTEGPRS